MARDVNLRRGSVSNLICPGLPAENAIYDEMTEIDGFGSVIYVFNRLFSLSLLLMKSSIVMEPGIGHSTLGGRPTLQHPVMPESVHTDIHIYKYQRAEIEKSPRQLRVPYSNEKHRDAFFALSIRTGAPRQTIAFSKLNSTFIYLLNGMCRARCRIVLTNLHK